MTTAEKVQDIKCGLAEIISCVTTEIGYFRKGGQKDYVEPLLLIRADLKDLLLDLDRLEEML